MVSAVVHSPLPVRAEPVQTQQAHLPSTSPGPAMAAQPVPAPALLRRGRDKESVPFDWHPLGLRVLPPLLGLGLLVGLWALVSINSTSGFPSPLDTLKQAIELFSDPFYRRGPNDQGIGW